MFACPNMFKTTTTVNFHGVYFFFFFSHDCAYRTLANKSQAKMSGQLMMHKAELKGNIFQPINIQLCLLVLKPWKEILHQLS